MVPRTGRCWKVYKIRTFVFKLCGVAAYEDRRYNYYINYKQIDMKKFESYNPQNSKENFLKLDSSYQIKLDQRRGENYLAEIAKVSQQEYCWAFDEKNGTWYYYPTTEHSESISRSSGKTSFKATIPKELMIPHGDLCTFYHIHPDSVIKPLIKRPKEGWHTKDFLMMGSQLPKEDDLKKAIVLNRYKEFKIVTSLGVTTYKFNPAKKEQREIYLPGFSMPSEELYKALSESFEAGVKKAMEYMNKNYEGVFTFTWEPLDMTG